MLTQFCKT